VVPKLPAHFSALGMLMADLRHDYVRTYYRPLAEADFTAVARLFAELEEQAGALLVSEGVRADAVTYQRFLDLRYVGQEFAVQTPVAAAEIAAADQATLRQRYDDLHDRRYGHHAASEAVEVVNLRLTARGRRERPTFPPLVAAGGDPLVGRRPVVLDDPRQPVDCPIYDRDRLAPGQAIEGPAIVEEYASTTVLLPGDIARPAPSGELIVTLTG
jgi:N-methylhydantoinase A